MMMRPEPAYSAILTGGLCALLIFWSLGAHAQSAGGSREDLWVDGPDAVQPGNQRSRPDSSIDSSGNMIFVWDARGGAGNSRSEVYVRRFDANGIALADPARVNTTFDDDQLNAHVAVGHDDSFLVIWESDEPDIESGLDRRFLRSQLFAANGDPMGTEQLLNTELTKIGDGLDSEVAALKDGGYVAVWRSRNSPGRAQDLYIEARLVNADGTPNGPEFKANASLEPSVGQPTVTGLADGGFLVVWTGSGVHLQGRRFLADGTPAGIDFQVNTLTEGTEAEPHAALHSDERVMVVWKTEEIPGEDREIRGRIFDASLQPLDDDFRINTATAGVQDDPKVADFGEEGFFVVWESAVSVGDDNGSRSIQGRMVRGSNEFANSQQFQVNRWTDGGQTQPGLSGRGDTAAVAWRSASNEDSTDDVITAQQWLRFDFFSDGFEAEEP